MAERITFGTMDGVTIVADWVTSPTTIGAVILVHAMPADRKSWSTVQQALSSSGLASLAIDLRGHGESVQGPGESSVDYKRFNEDEHQTSLYDLIGAYEWIQRRGIDPERVSLMGASIGANFAVRMLAEDTRLRAAVLLSPGRNYQGMNAVLDVESILPHQSVWIAASEGDDQESFEAAKEMYGKAPSEQKFFMPLKAAGHALNMFTAKPDILTQAVAFLRDRTQGV
jgi:alpha-beta hydrolase superfamily lysophospholipase